MMGKTRVRGAKVTSIWRIAVLLLVSVLLSVYVGLPAWKLTVPSCILSTGCYDHPDTSAFPAGVVVREYGFPVAYRAVTTFAPGSQAYAYTKGPMKRSMTATRNAVIAILIDTAFWYALLEVLASHLLPVLRKTFAGSKPE